ncbi:hypothetical protein [Ligilactobacillus saerimneri]
MTTAGEKTKKEPVAAGSEKKFLQEEYSTKIEDWELIAKAHKLAINTFDEPRDEFEMKNNAVIVSRYKLALDKIAYYKKLLAEVADE